MERGLKGRLTPPPGPARGGITSAPGIGQRRAQQVFGDTLVGGDRGGMQAHVLLTYLVALSLFIASASISAPPAPSDDIGRSVSVEFHVINFSKQYHCPAALLHSLQQFRCRDAPVLLLERSKFLSHHTPSYRLQTPTPATAPAHSTPLQKLALNYKPDSSIAMKGMK